MSILFKSVKVIDTHSPFHNKVVDVLVKNGKIESIKSSIKADKGYKVVEGENLHLSSGLFDMQVNFRDPGLDWKEDLNTGIKASAKGGFTGVL